MAETRITLTGVDNGVTSMMQRLRQSAQQSAQQLIQDARAQSKSAKDQIDLINQQIRAIEKKNRLQQTGRQEVLQGRLSSGDITKEEYGQQRSAIQKASREDKLQVDLLRELIETTKMTARQEILADEKQVQKELDQSRSYRQSDRVDSDDLFEVFKQDVQEEMLPKEEEESGRNNMINQIGPLLQQRNEVYALASLSKMIPVVGGTLNSLYQKALGQAERTESARGGVQGLLTDRVGFEGGGAARYGFTMAEFMSQYLQPTVRAITNVTSTADASNVAMQVLQAEKGLGLDKGILLERARLMRGSGEGFDPSMAIEIMGRSMANAGILGESNQNLAKLSEFMQIQNQLTSTQIQKFENLDQNINAVAISQFAGLGGSFDNPQVLGNVIRSVNDSLQNPATPYAQAMQFSTLAKLNPKASRFQLMEMQERGIQQPGLLSGMMEQISSASGGNQDLMMEQLKALMPQLSFSQVRRITEGYSSGQLNTDFAGQASDLASSADSEEMKRILAERAAGATGLMEARSAGLDNVFASEGERMAGELARFNNGMDLIKSTIQTILGTSTEVVKQVADLTDWMMGGGFESSTKKAMTDNTKEKQRTNKIQ